jgi:hypothetical protein
MINLQTESPHTRLDALIGISVRMSNQFKSFCRAAASSNKGDAADTKKRRTDCFRNFCAPFRRS